MSQVCTSPHRVGTPSRNPLHEIEEHAQDHEINVIGDPVEDFALNAPDPIDHPELRFGVRRFIPSEYHIYTTDTGRLDENVFSADRLAQRELFFDPVRDSPQAYANRRFHAEAALNAGHIFIDDYWANYQNDSAKNKAYAHLSRIDNPYSGAVFNTEEGKLYVNKAKAFDEAYNELITGMTSILRRNEANILQFKHPWDDDYETFLPWRHR